MIVKLTSLLSLLLVIGSTNGYAEPADTPLLSTAIPMERNRFYETILTQRENAKAVERAKIMYLIQRIRMSPLEFVRNGKTYQSDKAASHLLRKYVAVRNRIETAGQFINWIATKSEATGRLYMIRFPDGKTYPARDVLKKEISFLENQITGDFHKKKLVLPAV